MDYKNEREKHEIVLFKDASAKHLGSSLSLNARLSTIETTCHLVLDLPQTNLGLVLGELEVASWLPLHQATLLALLGTLVLCIVVLGTSSAAGI